MNNKEKKENIFKKGFKKFWVEEEHKSFSDAEIDEIISKKAAADSAYPYSPQSFSGGSDHSAENSFSYSGGSSYSGYSGKYDFSEKTSQPDIDIMGSQGGYQFGSVGDENPRDSFSVNSSYSFSPYDFNSQNSASSYEPVTSAIVVSDSNTSSFGGGIFDPDGLYIDWKDDAVAVSKLTVKNFDSFAKTRFEEIFLTAYSGARSKEKALNITCNVLARMLSYEAFTPDADNTPLSYAIESSLFVFMTKSQRAAAQEHPITMENVRNKPSGVEKDACIQKAFEKGKRDIPRYAPVFSGTTGATVVLLIVAVIIAATAFIWARPFGRSDEVSNSDVTEYQDIIVDSMTAINPDFLIDLNAEIIRGTSESEQFNTGTLPITLELDGPDVANLFALSALAPNDSEAQVFQHSSTGYCFFAPEKGNYRITAQDRFENLSVGYIRLPGGIEIPDSPVPMLSEYYAAPHDRDTVFALFDKETLEGAGYRATITKYPAGCSMSLNEDMTSAQFASQGITGLNSFTVKLSSTTTADSFEFVVPLMIYNNAPIVDVHSLSSNLLHTPNANGVFAGYLSASDPDGDDIRFELTASENCSVMLAPNGGFILVVDEGCTADSAWFGFTVSDGLLTTIEYRRVFTLENRLIDATEYVQEFVCYSGADAWYELELPKRDLDGDLLRWRVVSSLENGITEMGSSVKVSTDGATVSYKIDSNRNEAFEETILLVCTDGWDISEPVSFICRVKENAPPTGGYGNSEVISSGESVICKFVLSHDCPFDKDSDCRIVEISRCRGGEVVGTEGWDNLAFTFKHDGEREQCYVDAVIEDTLTGRRETIRFHITVQ